MRAVNTSVAAETQRVPAGIPRHAAFLSLVAVTTAWFWGPLTTVVNLSLRYEEYEHYSHIIMIPVISLFLIYLRRDTIFSVVDPGPRAGVIVMITAFIASWWPWIVRLDEANAWTIAIGSLVAMVIGAFIVCYGMRTFRSAAFPLLFLLFMVPLPPVMLHAVIGFLQRASAETSAILFDLIGVPVFRQGFVFALPGLTIEIAEECSGIRSSIALFIVGLVAAHLYLRSTWAKGVVALAAVPVAIMKNSVRIVVLSLLGTHVDPGFVGPGLLHRNSGIPVFAMAFASLGAIIWLLHKSEARLDRRVARAAR
jgi:exosortase